MYISYVGIRNSYPLFVCMWVCGKMSQTGVGRGRRIEKWFVKQDYDGNFIQTKITDEQTR